MSIIWFFTVHFFWQVLIIWFNLQCINERVKESIMQQNQIFSHTRGVRVRSTCQIRQTAENENK